MKSLRLVLLERVQKCVEVKSCVLVSVWASKCAITDVHPDWLYQHSRLGRRRGPVRGYLKLARGVVVEIKYKIREA